MEYFSAIKRDKLLTHLQGFMLSEKSQSQKVMYHMIPFYNILKMAKFYKDGEQLNGYQVPGVRK